MNISKVFDKKPAQWGLRGDPYLWSALADWFSNQPMPVSIEMFSKKLESAFEEITGISLGSREENIYIEAFNKGGMSGGFVSLEFWRERGIPRLIDNYRLMMRDNAV